MQSFPSPFLNQTPTQINTFVDSSFQQNSLLSNTFYLILDSQTLSDSKTALIVQNDVAYRRIHQNAGIELADGHEEGEVKTVRAEFGACVENLQALEGGSFDILEVVDGDEGYVIPYLKPDYEGVGLEVSEDPEVRQEL